MAESPRPASQSQAQVIRRPHSSGKDVAWNEMKEAGGKVRGHWRELERQMQQWDAGERRDLAATAARMIEDLGTTFNVFSDAGGVGQPYGLDSIPLVISSAEWAVVSAGLCQRARLLDAVLADLYGPQTLMKKGLVPPGLVHANPGFEQYVRGLNPTGGRFLVLAGCDLVRGKGGSWQVLRDHSGNPGGLGQVFENRKVISNLLSGIYDGMRVAKLGGFLNLERSSLQAHALTRGERANIVFLTPGFRHPSYFEHAYHARLLGFPLVETDDLTVRERRVYLKTLAGLRRIDGVVCRTGQTGLDPLEHWGGGAGGGVPGIAEAWRTGNVALANGPGSVLASSVALLPFLPRICREWFGEELKLGFVETWWLGQEGVRKRVLADLNRYVLLSASPFGEAPLPIRCAGLSPTARRQWMATIESRPWDFVAQVDVVASEAPSLVARGIRDRPVIWRAFALNARGGSAALPGGLAQVGKSGYSPQLWPNHAGFTKDVWVPESGIAYPKAEIENPHPRLARHEGPPEVPSRIAEQLFWLGRYAERIELETRLLRAALGRVAGDSGRRGDAQVAACVALIEGAGLIPEGMSIRPNEMLKTVSRMVHDAGAAGGIPSLTRSLLFNAAAARDRLSDDTWRFFNLLEGIVFEAKGVAGVAHLQRKLDTLVLHLAAFAGMQAENMTRGHGWRFLEIGRRVERAMGTSRLLAVAAKEGEGESLVLEPVLEACDSVMTYRRRHFSRPVFREVVNLVFRDASNPRSVMHQLQVVHDELSQFTIRPNYGLLPKIREDMDQLLADCLKKGGNTPEKFEGMADALEEFSDLLTQHFFSHSVRRVY
ncbi:MAG: circularly permuted type 2 ATP-grasp protein [Verrucomicrobiota bacterium JB025]|nr:circularly permuted type 2 ATP-grasp protein [Verrucomicrobiota bacterium JB025]